MEQNPLAAPAGPSPLLGRFAQHFGIERGREPLLVLTDVVQAFAHLPYENLSKILKEATAGRPAAARRGPAEVIADHVQFGTGGTCFSLTAALLHLVRALGWQAEPLLADRRYGPDTHCALLVWIDGQPHLVDPGFLLLQPVPLPTDSPTTIATGFNNVVLAPQTGDAKIDLLTVRNGQTKYRLTFKAAPADAGEFLRAWDASFDWDMMHYPVLTRVRADRQLYLQGNRLAVRGPARVERATVAAGELAAQISTIFGIAPAIPAAALAILRRKGESLGTTPAA